MNTTIRQAIPGALWATSFVLDYTDRSGERQSAHYSGDSAFARAAKGLQTLREQRATAITVTARFANGEETAALSD